MTRKTIIRLLGAHCLFVAVLFGVATYANDYYNGGSFPATGSAGTSASMRAEFAAITAGFNKLATLTGNANKFLVVNGSGTSVTTSTFTYSTGVWTPSVGGTATYTSRTGTYTKLGQLVCIQGSMVINTIGTGSTSQIDGLPVATANTTFQTLTVAKTSSLALSVTSIQAVTGVASSSLFLYSRTAAATSDAINAVLGNGSNVSISGCYQS